MTAFPELITYHAEFDIPQQVGNPLKVRVDCPDYMSNSEIMDAIRNHRMAHDPHDDDFQIVERK